MHKSQSLFNLTTALHVSGVTITHLQEHKTTVITASGNRYTVLLSAAIVEELELIWVCCGWRVDQHGAYNTLISSCWNLYTRILLRCTDPWTLNIRTCNENQLDALFILSLFRQSPSTWFRAYSLPNIRRYTVYIQQLVCYVLFSWLSVGRPTRAICCVYRVYLLMMGYRNVRYM